MVVLCISLLFPSHLGSTKYSSNTGWFGSVSPRVPAAKLVEAHASVGTQSGVFKRTCSGFFRQVRRTHLLLENALQSSRARPRSKASAGFDLEQNLVRRRLSSKGKGDTGGKTLEAAHDFKHTFDTGSHQFSFFDAHHYSIFRKDKLDTQRGRSCAAIAP